MLDIQQQIINFNKTQRSIQPQYIVIHDTGDAGATAQNEHDYFSGGDRGASADFFVDSNNIIQIIDTDTYYSWHCGDGHGAYGIYNSNSLGIEMCLSSDGQPSDATIQNTIDLVKYLMSKHGIDIDHVVRHYDASRKSCPCSFMDNNWTKWNEFKEKLSQPDTILGWNKDSTGSWYCTDVTNKTYYKDSWQYIDSKWYSFDSDGYARHDCWIQDGGKYYYLNSDCSMTMGWIKYDDNYYYLAKNGAMCTGWIVVDGNNYLLDSTGAMYKDSEAYGYRFNEMGVATKIS